jgi:hypothetical protein
MILTQSFKKLTDEIKNNQSNWNITLELLDFGEDTFFLSRNVTNKNNSTPVERFLTFNTIVILSVKKYNSLNTQQ